MFQYKFNEDQEAWLHDLETTDAPQAMGKLHIADKGFCCLGRACVLLHDKYNLRRKEVVDGGANEVSFMYADAEERLASDWRGSVLPNSIATALKLRTVGGHLKERFSERQFSMLTEMNDRGNWTFKEIAKYCRDNPSNVFDDYDEQFKQYTDSNPEH